MKAAAPSFLEHVGRFARWFFTVSPSAALDPWPADRPAVTAARRGAPLPRVRAHHAGPVRVVVKGKP